MRWWLFFSGTMMKCDDGCVTCEILNDWRKPNQEMTRK
jgi:hypothetical protein